MIRTIAALTIVPGVLGHMAIAYCDPAAMPDLKDPRVISAGRDLYRAKHCSHCHGRDGNGGVSLTKRDLRDPKSVFETIADGREKGGLRMPAGRGVLTDTEIWEAVAYVMSLTQAPNSQTFAPAR
jgi:mono/diheme cytochrome c family protein